ncbi:ABC transporter substrate-binding protein [Weizmannia acidilactici]|uniref:ABC transporter substrate-binding protein n=1 Tax=Weizmannia acidilactici TaxID=2607726 RepID=A0A5J4JMU0_9BACI|nr:ABC transporter substrate-binding protein [Weizmannia acidilactici]GER70304.1 ABC transporter substrate-binding protein [Weizmannia acidilactici]GER73548.1 ABC transporter substrate-binding protein [Weizmannia acidilactici]
MKKLWILTAALALILGACSSRADHTSKHHLQKITIMLDWYPNAVHSFLYVAQEKGYFKEQGLDVSIKMPSDTNDPLKLVAANQVDIALSYQPQVLMARDENIPVQSFGAVVRHTLNRVMVPASSNIRSPKDLAGKTVGYSSIPLYEAAIRTMVKTDGGNPNKVKTVDVGYDLIPALATHKTDAIIGGFVNHEKLLLEKEGHAVRTFNPAKYGVPDYYELVLIANENKLKQQPEIFKKFLTAAEKGQQYVEKHSQKGLAILLKHEDPSSPLDKNVETKSLQILLPLMDEKNKPFAYQDPKSWEKVSDWLYQTKMTKTHINAEKAFTNLSK